MCNFNRSGITATKVDMTTTAENITTKTIRPLKFNAGKHQQKDRVRFVFKVFDNYKVKAYKNLHKNSIIHRNITSYNIYTNVYYKET